ncbi:MAG: thrombospondin type 3 repeat-containing protein, partial [Nitrosarchaeum sp.]|nr:thrombospondin type 3 repeat-containing protein [Nitrosarchaeum sp.]
MNIVWALVIASLIFTSNVFAQEVSKSDSVETEYNLERVIIPATGSSIPGCEITEEGCYIPKKTITSIGGKIVFSNTDNVEHTFTAISSEGTLVFDSGIVNPGNSYEWVPIIKGEYPFNCTIHPWMTGTIIVEEIQNPPKDIDGDGILDDVDSCPTQAETINGFEDTDGCPDAVPPKDIDGDGILDDVDSCPTQAETVNGFEDTDGCPDAVPPKDIDGDGILDDVDSCPTQAET